MFWDRFSYACLAAATLLVAGPLSAATEPFKTAAASTVHATDALAAKRAALAAQIARLTKADSESGHPQTARSKADDDILALLRSLDALYAQQQTRLEQRQQLETQVKEADKELETLDKFAPDEPKPYSFLLLEGLKDQLAAEEDREKAIKADLKSAEQLLKAAHEQLDELASAPHATKENPEHSGTSQILSEPELETSLARARVALKQVDVQRLTLQLTLCQTRQKQLSKKIDVVAKDVAFSVADRDNRLAHLAATEEGLKRQRRQAESRFRNVESDQQSDLTDLKDEKTPQHVVDAATQAWHTAADVYQAESVILDQRLENLGVSRRYWKRRYDLANGSLDSQQMSRWLDDLDEFVDQLDDMSHSLELRRDSLHEDQTVGSGDDSKQDDEATAKWTAMRHARSQELRDLCETSVDEIRSSKLALSRFRTELKDKIKHAGAWGGLGASLSDLLNYKLTDDKQSITIGKLLVLLASVVGGTILAYFISRLIGRRLLPLLGFSRGTTSALKSIAFYALCLLFGVVAFHVLRIPLAAFAFLGGAAAIAVGFGSQDIMNNFMSGIILLSEQPIRVGDVVELKDVQGEVTHIGLRSTRLRTNLNHELIVPNKSLLDEQVTNLTLSDDFVQMFVAITLDGTADVQLSKRQMLHAAFLHPLVLKAPRPVVLLKEYDSFYGCMSFEVHFSVQLNNVMKCAIVQSEVLEAISDLFKPKKEDDEHAQADQPTEEVSPAQAETAQAETLDAASSDVPASSTAPIGESNPMNSPRDSSLLAGLGKISPLALLKEAKRARSLSKAKG